MQRIFLLQISNKRNQNQDGEAEQRSTDKEIAVSDGFHDYSRESCQEFRQDEHD